MVPSPAGKDATLKNFYVHFLGQYSIIIRDNLVALSNTAVRLSTVIGVLTSFSQTFLGFSRLFQPEFF